MNFYGVHIVMFVKVIITLILIQPLFGTAEVFMKSWKDKLFYWPTFCLGTANVVSHEQSET